MEHLSPLRKDGLDNDAEPLATKKELAQRLRMSERWIENRMRDGLPHLRFGTAVRFQPAEVMAWLIAIQEVAR